MHTLTGPSTLRPNRGGICWTGDAIAKMLGNATLGYADPAFAVSALDLRAIVVHRANVSAYGTPTSNPLALSAPTCRFN